MSGQRCLNGAGGSFRIADFSDEYDVRVMSEDTAEAGGEVQSDL
jgi:hypothetical protein